MRWLCLGLCLGLGSLSLVSAQVFDLQAHRWQSRVLLLFSPTAEDAALQEQRRWLHAVPRELQERDLVVVEAVQGQATSQLPAAEARRLRQQYNVPEGSFTVMLIGKDGSVKLRNRKPLQMQKLFSLIDSMPMRQREKDERGQR